MSKNAFVRPAARWLLLGLALASTACPPEAQEPDPEVQVVVLDPAVVEIDGGESVSFEVVVAGEAITDSTVTWSLEGDDGDTIDAQGRFEAGAPDDTDRLVTVIATSNLDPSVHGTATVVVLGDPPLVAVHAVALNPESATLAPGASATFAATVTGDNLPDATVDWSLQGGAHGDTIDAQGVFVAGSADPTDRLVTVVGASRLDPGVRDTSTVTVEGWSVEAVTVDPLAPSVAPGASQAFAATVEGEHLPDATVAWHLEGAGAGDAIDTDGLFVAGPADAVDRVVTVVATSRADADVRAATTVTVEASFVESVAVDPLAPSIPAGGTQAFTATVAGQHLTDATVTWRLEGASPGDAIDADGLFVAGPAVAGAREVEVVATSDQDPGVYGFTTVTVTPLDAFDAAEVWVDAASPADPSLGPPGSMANPFPTLEQGVAAVAEDGVLHVAAGTYVLSGTLSGFAPGVSLLGAGSDAVLIDASANTSYGLLIDVDGLTLSGFTLEGPQASAPGDWTTARDDYGIKTTPPIDGLTLEDLVVRDGHITQIDLNGVSNGVLRDVVATSKASSPFGVGISLVSAHHVTLEGVRTFNNPWGGVGLFSGAYVDDTPDAGDHVTIDATSDIADGVYIDDEYTDGDLVAFGDNALAIAGVEFMVTNAHFRDGLDGRGEDFVFFARDEAEVEALAARFGPAASFTVARPLTRDAEGYIQPGTDLIVVPGLDLQLAVDLAGTGDTVNVAPGTYALDATLGGFADGVVVQGAGPDLVVIDASAVPTYGVLVTSDDVTLAGFTLEGPKTGTTWTTARDDFGIKCTGQHSGLVLEDLVVQNSHHTEIDLNNMSDAVLRRVSALNDDEASAFFGVGVAMPSVHGVVLEHVTTQGNPWGGVGIYSGAYYGTPDPGDDISIDLTNDISEGIYIDDEKTDGELVAFGDNKLALEGVAFMVTNTTFRDGIDGRNDDFVFFAHDLDEVAAIEATFPAESLDDTVVRTVTTDANGYAQPGEIVP